MAVVDFLTALVLPGVCDEARLARLDQEPAFFSFTSYTTDSVKITFTSSLLVLLLCTEQSSSTSPQTWHMTSKYPLDGREGHFEEGPSDTKA